MANPPIKSLSRLRNTTKGPVHHIEIHPATNSRGKRAFITKTYRKPPMQVQQAAAASGAYCPDCQLDAETPHETGADMLQHVANSYRIKPPAAAEDDDEDTEV